MTADTGGTIHYYHRNQQYSITAMTTSIGAVAERYAYTAYGQPTILNASGTLLTSSAVGSRYTYTGREWDETLGLHHFRARWMSPLAGRFLGRDPLRYKGSEWGLYEFVRSRPMAAADPFGLEYLDLPATPDKCAWAVFYMKYYALVRALGTWDNILLNHYMGGTGTPVELSMGAFDDWGTKRRSMASKIAAITEADAWANTPCNNVASNGGVLQELGQSITAMVNYYTMTAYYGWGAKKTCDCNGKCTSFTGAYSIDFVATDRTDFDANKGVYVLGIGFSDRLIVACGIGVPFDISAKSSDSGTFSGCK